MKPYASLKRVRIFCDCILWFQLVLQLSLCPSFVLNFSWCHAQLRYIRTLKWNSALCEPLLWNNCCTTLFCSCHCYSIFLFPTSLPVKSNSPPVTSLSFMAQGVSQGVWKWLLGLSFHMHINQWLWFSPRALLKIQMQAALFSMDEHVLMGFEYWVQCPQNPPGVHTWAIVTCAWGELGSCDSVCAAWEALSCLVNTPELEKVGKINKH